MSNRIEIEKRLAKAILTDEKSVESIMCEYTNIISQDIALAIGGINPVSAPFVVALLETYAQKIRGKFHGIDAPVADIKNMSANVVEVVIPRGKT